MNIFYGHHKLSANHIQSEIIDELFLNDIQIRRELFTDEPVLVVSREILERSAKLFISDFPGKTLYAVKCNPHPDVLKVLVNAGITDFDAASLEEIRLIKSINSTLKCYFNHPIKARRAIREAYYNYNVRDFVIDNRDEWQKICDEIDIFDITVQIRLNVISGSNLYDFGHKFGMDLNSLCEFAVEISMQKVNWAISFHVGSQCIDPQAFVNAILQCKEVVKRTGLTPKYVNIGGGFPGHYPNTNAPRIDEYFSKIRQVCARINFPALFCEPGRALVCHSGMLILQILARNKNKLYLNDGVYGALGEINYAKIQLKAIAIDFRRELSKHNQEFIIFGPTCDSFDTLEQTFSLPHDVAEGNWIVIFDLGAYSTSLSSHFNGFYSNKVVIL